MKKNIYYYWDRFVNWFTYKFRNPYGIYMPYGVCPVQSEGKLGDGNYYYFRSRGTTWSLHLAKKENEIFDKPIFKYHEDCYEWPHAGWISKSKAILLATKALNLYYDNYGKNKN